MEYIYIYIYTLLKISWSSHVIVIEDLLSNHDHFVLDGCHVGGSWSVIVKSYSLCRRE